jgi:hypothetical protein
MPRFGGLWQQAFDVSQSRYEKIAFPGKLALQ